MNNIYLEFYNPEKTYLFPSMEQAEPATVQAMFTAVNMPNARCVITTDSSATMFYAIELLPALAQRYNMNTNDYETEDELLSAIELAINEATNTPPPEPGASAEERIAAALEFQTVLLIPDEEV